MAYYSKIYANAVAKYNSGKLLSSEKLKRLSDADFADAVKMLIDYGYGGGYINEQSYNADAFLNEETARLIEFVNTDCPGAELKRILLNKYYYSDAKVYYKSKYVTPDEKAALYGNFESLKQAVETGGYAELPRPLSDALTELNERYFEKRPSPKEIDIRITKAMYEDSLNAANISRNKSLKKYIRTEIDFANILTAFRFRKLELNSDDFINEFIEGGFADFNKVNRILTTDRALVAEAFENTEYAETIEKLYENADFAGYERDSDDTLYSIMASKSEDMNSYSPFINYFMAKTNEFKTVKTILVCLKNNARSEIGRRIRILND